MLPDILLGMMAKYRLEDDWPYIPLQATIDQMVQQGTYGPPQACQDNNIYGYVPNGYKIITDQGLVGEDQEYTLPRSLAI